MIASKEGLKQWLEHGKIKGRTDAPEPEVWLKSAGESILRGKNISNMSITRNGQKIEGFGIKLYQPFYKACPLGMLLDVELVVDGHKFERDEMFLILDGGQRVAVPEARTIQDIAWHILRPITLFAPKRGGLTPGRHHVELRAAEYITEYYKLPDNMLFVDLDIEMIVQ